ncbi:efflux RND transporter periplasmic adaptor subunit [Phaeovibrio sulfidiphilus]|uniref:Efflux RND transporter periplasmic adaptor subunit n=1 Tax=Phaeovibrio sulfidiphilus TaxID=1220600 RepID=A0A8J7CWP2_9PROT|nr:efflux RND transporter periplasmic adaptor subunit [Phaeovibrio sulfidiphilus]MBE1237741.1 efflux RND transporter periplasmic adaptor subunit [Phaeovibrio sulfidiphilus]
MTPALKKRLPVLLLGGGVLLALVWFVAREWLSDDGPLYLTQTVHRGSIEDTILATGTLKPARLVAVGAQVSGRVTKLRVQVGDTVRAGDLVAEIDSIPQENALKTAEATLANIRAQKVEREAQLLLARQTFERQKRSLEMRAVSKADYDTAEADLKTRNAQIAALDAQIAEAEVSVETARVNLGYTRITAPIDGTVLSIVTQEGQTVNAVQSAPTIIVLGQLDHMLIRVEISEVDVVHLSPGQPLYFTILGNTSKRWEGTLDFIEPAPESIKNDSAISSSTLSTSSTTEAVYYNGVFTVPNPDGRLRTYMTAEVRLVLGQKDNVLIVPSSALGAPNAEGRCPVRVLDAKGNVEERFVRVGLNNKVDAEILDGLSEGETVITGMLPGKSGPPPAGPPGSGMRMRM